MVLFLLIGALLGVFLLIVGSMVGGAMTVKYGPLKEVRCPSCTQKQLVRPGQHPDYNCNACGTPILRGGQFVASSEVQPGGVSTRS